jgi:hypothetical protein
MGLIKDRLESALKIGQSIKDMNLGDYQTYLGINLEDLQISIEEDIEKLEYEKNQLLGLKVRIKSQANAAANRINNAASGKGHDKGKGGSGSEEKLFDASKYDESNNLLQKIDSENERQ